MAILTTHPIQYYAPVFTLLHQRQKVSIKVFYTLGNSNEANYDPGFGKTFNWDIPLLSGYPYDSLSNTASNPGTRNFNGIINPDLTDKINEWEPDGILIYGWAHQSHLKALRYYKNKIPVYFRGDSTILVEQKGINKYLKYIFLRWVYSHVDHAFYVGKNNKAYFAKYGLKDEQLSFAPHATDNDRFNKSHTAEANELRSDLNLKIDDNLILFAGKFEQVKNVGLLLSAFINLNRKDAHLLLVGNGINEDELKTQALSSGLKDNIHFMDFKNQTFMPVLYQAADLFCLPSKSESWGLAVNEAMACGKPVLASDKVGSAADLVQQGQNGAVFKAGSLTGLSENLNELLSKGRHGLYQMGECSKNIINKWTFENQVKSIESFIINDKQMGSA